MKTEMIPIDKSLESWATDKIKKSHQWGIAYWFLHNGFLILSWLLSLGVLVGIPILYLSGKQYSCAWNVVILLASGIALILQILDVVLFFRDRAARGRRMSANLEYALFRYREGIISKEEFLLAVGDYLSEEWNEQSS